jgi:ribose 5-phosphate isomerase B
MPDSNVSESRIRERVRAIVHRTLGRTAAEGATRRPIVKEADIIDLPFRAEFEIPADALVTPLARQAMLERQVQLAGADRSPQAVSSTGGKGPIAVGADHAGFELKEDLKRYLAELGYGVIDCGTTGKESVDYPDYALAVAELVTRRRAELGIVVDGAGIGSSVVANKVPGIRAALCYDQATAVNSREHNDANVLTLGAGMIGASLARGIVRAWLASRFAGGRHARRVNKITEIERRYSRP